MLVIGAGSAGLGAARAARAAKRTVVLVEAERPGGDCTWTGCVPSKTLIATARMAHQARTSAARGIRATIRVDFPAAMAHVRSTIDEIFQDESPDLLRREGIDLLTGTARFIGRDTVDVDGHRITARRIVLAVGASPQLPEVPGLADVPCLTSETVWDLTQLPSHLIVLGGGPVGCELAQCFLRLGSRVTLLQSQASLLPRDEPAAAAVLAAVLRREGVDLRLGATVTGAARGAGGSGEVCLSLSDGSAVIGSHLLVAVGRSPRTGDLDVHRAGVELTESGHVSVDSRLRSTAEHVWAVGDCASRLCFTHLADDQARLAVRNLLFADDRRAALRRGQLAADWDETQVPWVTFTDPEVAHVGLTEAQAHAQFGAAALVASVPLAAVDRARCAGETDGFVQLIAAPGRVRAKVLLKIVGMTAVAPTGGELIAPAALAMRTGMLAGRLAQTTAAYPTWSVATRVAAALFFTDIGGLRARPASAAAPTTV